jgi:hypothetical protein
MMVEILIGYGIAIAIIVLAARYTRQRRYEF